MKNKGLLDREVQWLRAQAKTLRGAANTISEETFYGRGQRDAYEEVAKTLERRARQLRAEERR